MRAARSTILMLMATTLVGCASTPSTRSASVESERSGERTVRVESTQPTQPARIRREPSAALAFTPPVARHLPPLYLDRDERGPVAYGGYEQVVVSETWVRQDDQQRYNQFGDYGRFERRAVSTTVTVRGR